MKTIASLSDRLLSAVAPKQNAAALGCVSSYFAGACGCQATWLKRIKMCLDPVVGWYDAGCQSTSTHC